ncbi:hypothetical protein OW763_00275 [Clostridium aestuarii]|uniref:Uncharacterized protein n=1 Tax=Clostridium aestuarii TaxID=338193 RepID=A0ABT4CUY1_9CLOT|nr:hypothetical protein [Clostridium aestuarii]MCY6482793.1 hypothetical protein [Clostridium aestuarii]
MKKIAFVGKEQNKIFKAAVLKFISSRGIEYEDVSYDIIHKDVYADYVIVNSHINTLNSKINCRYCFINMDSIYQEKISINGNLITYGFGNKNTITISSVENENEGFVYCIQRFLVCSNSNIVEPQEIPIEVAFDTEEQLYSYMVAITISLIEKVDSKKIFNKE